MPLENVQSEKIAIIGSGISGLAAAYELSGDKEVTLFEASDRLGGHARTVMAGKTRSIAVDTGFIVFNFENYPNLTRMFDALNVPVKQSNMNFAASIGGGKIEYGVRSLKTLFAQKRNLLRPQFWRMLADILRFNKTASAAVRKSDMSIADLLDHMKMGRWFRDYYFLPISGAIWSSTPEQIKDFPARSLIKFFENHALLSTNNHQWYTVDGGSIAYVDRIANAIKNNGGIIKTNTAVEKVHRSLDGLRLQRADGQFEYFDQVVFACHSDDALRLIADPSNQEKSLLGAIKYQDNLAVLHCDETQMPKLRKCWSSWVYQTNEDKPSPTIGITYWMNSLQNLDPSDPLFVTLNPQEKISANTVYDEKIFRHPIFDHAAIEAQQGLKNIQGQNRSWFCGAYMKNGFHEDGYASAMDVVEALKSVEIPA